MKNKRTSLFLGWVTWMIIAATAWYEWQLGANGKNAFHGPWWHSLPCFSVLLGLAAGLALMFLAQFLGNHGLYRQEDYYKK